MQKVRTRYAPSPTGVLHIGGVRTALFNFLFTKTQKGDFLLRMEDTDRKRFETDSVNQIKKSLNALSLKWDEYHVQSERLNIYDKYLNELKKKGAVYKDEGAWRFKVKKGKNLIWLDGVHGKVQFNSNVIEDFVILKSDKFPTYHFANVVDDTQMNISHVLRGDEWLSSTPKHLMLYEALGWQPPIFIHVPVILGPDHKKLSKRQGAKSVLEYIDDGYLPEAITNYLALLGWAPSGDREIFSLEELIKEFSIERINKNSPIFNIEKLKWFNGQWIRRLDEQEYINKIIKFYPTYDSLVTQAVAPLTQDRVATLADYAKLAAFFYEKPKEIPSVGVSAVTISHLSMSFSKANSWVSDELKKLIDQVAELDMVNRIDLIAGVRNIVSGSTVTPPLYESLEKLGKIETIDRLNKYVKGAKLKS
ncbi:glutamate--tRNA ligase [Candidatus Curtissbacteria bacterium RIFCSPLOWO2_01_FULL_38_11b]|uniref:Glutamate--tRNA ligase n=1 Tax=Candidatus Curtissbacteria bacterium RIFCSPLOWO2_01_FULL_38_11b TaxID=1797725 RepID=A0A1F5H011_9BACT|nr:MAG: glutamate--tRNA ligase [Candidatus Curtissbacteria bacterium RIFCSPLOWO2_01_FULL_38_11b]